jgi:uncharacterized DUF497 family protein
MSGIGPYVWDETKRTSNRRKHAVDFASIADFELETAVTTKDDRKNYGEDRFRAIGLINARLHVLVFTPRGGLYRVISLRKANAKEIENYAASKNL